MKLTDRGVAALKPRLKKNPGESSTRTVRAFFIRRLAAHGERLNPLAWKRAFHEDDLSVMVGDAPRVKVERFDMKYLGAHDDYETELQRGFYIPFSAEL